MRIYKGLLAGILGGGPRVGVALHVFAWRVARGELAQLPEEPDLPAGAARLRGVGRGLHRVFVYDQNANLITYGDIQID